jgi:hypothetical protein
MLVCAFYHFIAHETAGAACIRLSLRPDRRGREVASKPRVQRAARSRSHVCSPRSCPLKFRSKLSQRHCEEHLRRSNLSFFGGAWKKAGLLRGACHRARIRATRWLAMTLIGLFEIRKTVARMEPTGRRKAPPVGAIRGQPHSIRDRAGGRALRTRRRASRRFAHHKLQVRLMIRRIEQASRHGLCLPLAGAEYRPRLRRFERSFNENKMS